MTHIGMEPRHPGKARAAYRNADNCLRSRRRSVLRLQRLPADKSVGTPVTGSPRRLLGRSPIERSTAGVRVPAVECPVRGIAAANHLTVTTLVAEATKESSVATATGSVAGSRRSAIAGKSDFCLGFRITPAASPLARPPVLQYVHSTSS